MQTENELLFLLNLDCEMVLSLPLDELSGLPQIFIQLYLDNKELE